MAYPAPAASRTRGALRGHVSLGAVHHLLTEISGPDDVKRLSPTQLAELADHIREHLIASVSRTGGHLGPNLGVVELTLALHRVYDSPRDSIIFDTGHQCYVHKLLTGRQDFSTLRAEGGLSGYPCRAESDHDVVENSHASTSLSWAHGIARARERFAETDRHTVAIIGDGALTGGMAWEALNNIAADSTGMVVVVNDNARSYAPTIGGLADHLSTLRTTGGYEWFLKAGKAALHKAGPPGRLAYDTLHGVKKGLKDIVAPQGLFEDLGLKYIGPVDGHDVEALEHALSRAKQYGGPVIVHAITCKGYGYEPAMQDEADQFHAVGVIDPATGKPLSAGRKTWTEVFADTMEQLGATNPDVVGITAAMMIPVGLHKFAAAYPDRVYDVGIAEQHAVATAAGLAYGGLHPVVAVYSTFLNRAFDQVLMDVALHREAVTLVLDRAGITGPDGASHHGMWDLALLQMVPGIAVAAPRDADELVEVLHEAVQTTDGPTVVRFGKGAVTEPVPAVRRHGTVDVLAEPEEGDAAARVLLVGVGPMASVALEAAGLVAEAGITCTVVDPRWVLPISDDVVKLAAEHEHVVTIEDGVRTSGVGARLLTELAAAGHTPSIQIHGIPDEFVEHASRESLLQTSGLTAAAVAQQLTERFA